MKRILAVLLLCAAPALAQEAVIRQALEARLGLKVESVQPSPVAGLYEVRMSSADGSEILYADAQGNHIIVGGNIIDLKNKRNLTTAIKFETLPLDLAVKVQRGSGKRVLAMFSDPYCPYCKQLEKTLIQIDDVTIYVFMYPVIRPDLAEHSKAVWCSPDRGKAWVDLALRGRQPVANAACDNPLDKLREIGKKLRVRSTPTLYFADGERFEGGGLSAEQLRAMLDDPARQTKTR